MNEPKKRIKRVLVVLFIVLFVVVCLMFVGMWAVKKGMSPLIDGAKLQDGRVIVIVDQTSPMPVAAYLLTFGDGTLGLIDATMDPEAKAILAALNRMGRSEDDVKAVFLTHLHNDHTAGCRKFTKAAVYAMKSPLQGTHSSGKGEGGREGQGFSGQQHNSYTTKSRIEYLTDEQSLLVGGDRIESYALPGHTYDSAAYLVFGVLFVGDSAAGQYNGSIGGAPPFVSKDRALNRIELKKLASRLANRKGQINYIAFGHQGPITGLDPLLSWAATH